MLDSLMSLNVLIVDDNESAADLLQELLQLQDHKALCAYTGQQALDAAAGNDFNVALVDLTLPDMPGTLVAQQLRAKSGGPQLIVAVSGHAPSEATQGLFDHHLQKPIDFDALDRILAQAA
ncbi:response regulator [Variovorax sp. OV329]|uniref:response regulator n=1 Tax=Variovorax sp. OV329 TaxID=1882825 RepID=UPI0008F28753|nr:response regulator [Variovorax sp. OV329]SFM89815.1 Response regulator receiver domain-containing protein [Variovorax sp. OV329]